ncbi:MAG: T9SS type A sorting domain-containing protein [Owenweeksia sp.]|nr:T9SS type A sorting domain-containing protein [Owenweeksia sp.]
MGQPTLPNSLNLCENDDPVNFSLGQNLNWSGKGMTNPQVFNPTAAGVGRHLLNYIYIDQNGCVTNGTIAITVSSKPTVPQISRVGSNTLTTGAYDTYQWYRDGVAISGATLQSFSYTTGGNYQVMVGNTASCQNHSKGFVVGSGNGGIGLEENLLSNLSIYPNPTHGKLIIDLNNTTREEIEVSLFNLTGKRIMQVNNLTEASGKLQLNLEDLPKAAYVLRISSGSAIEVRQIVIY